MLSNIVKVDPCTEQHRPFVLNLDGKLALSLTLAYVISVFPTPLTASLVKASASRAEGPGFESHLRRDFFGVESYP